MAYWAPKFEHRNKQREAEYDEKHLSDCKEVKTYKLTPEEIEARYGDCKGQGEKVSSLANVRNLTNKVEVDEMGKIYETGEVIEAVKKTMEELNITEHSIGARDISKHLKKYETTIYNVMGGMTGLADALGLPTIAEYKKEQAKNVGEPKAKKEAAPEVVTMTSEPVKQDTTCPVFAEYSKKVNECTKYMIELKETYDKQSNLQQKLKALEIWLEGFEAAAKLAGVSLE